MMEISMHTLQQMTGDFIIGIFHCAMRKLCECKRQKIPW